MKRAHVVVLPGGGYQFYAPNEEGPIIDWLQGIGYEASIFHYPLNALHPSPVRALREEVTRLRKEGAYKVGVMGFSAGGHLAGHAALTPSSVEDAIDFAVLGYAITSMELNTYRPAQDALLGSHPSRQALAETSLDQLVLPGAPPFFLWHTAEDMYVSPDHTYRLAQALSAASVPHAVHVFEHGPHSLGLARGAGAAEAWTTLAAPWMDEYAR